MKHLFAVFALNAVALAQPITANMTTFKASNAKVEFAYKVTLIPVNGTANALTTKTTLDFEQLNKTKATVQVDLNTLKTGIGLRDEHAREALGAKEYPQATFNLLQYSGPQSIAGGQTVKGNVSGNFTFKGVSKPLKAPVTLTRTGNTLLVNTMFNINPQAHGVRVKGGDTKTRVTVTFTLMPN